MDITSQPSSSTTAVTVSAHLGGRAIDRHNPIIRDGRRFTPPPSPNTKSSSHHHHRQSPKTKMGLVIGGNYENSKEQKRSKKNKKGYYGKGKKPSDHGEVGKSPATVTPPGSTRYLLGDPVFFDGLVDSDPVPISVDPVDDPERIRPVVDDYKEDRLIINASKILSSTSSFLEMKKPDFFDGFLDYDPVLSPENPIYDPNRTSPSSSQSSQEDKHVSVTTPNVQSSSLGSSFSEEKKPSLDQKPSSDQVVVLRVSLHCKGCAGKVRKHLSKMQGVTSFNIDFPAKKVTVTGDITPLGVLASISKVKNAQFWQEIKK